MLGAIEGPLPHRGGDQTSWDDTKATADHEGGTSRTTYPF